MSFIFDVLPNYTGPYISDGKFQSSVKFGKTPPKNPLDSESRLHDTAYAAYPDRLHRAAADELYTERAYSMGGFFPSIAGFAVRYGNYLSNFGSNPCYDCSDYGNARKEILNLYSKDPYGGGGVKMWDFGGEVKPLNPYSAPADFYSKPNLRPVLYAKPVIVYDPDPSAEAICDTCNVQNFTRAQDDPKQGWLYYSGGRYKNNKKKKRSWFARNRIYIGPSTFID